MQPSECTQVNARKWMQPINVRKGMQPSEYSLGNAADWMGLSECNKNMKLIGDKAKL